MFLHHQLSGAAVSFTDSSADLSCCSGDDLERVRTELGLGPVMMLSQVHGAQVHVVDDDYLNARAHQCDLPEGDGFVTRICLSPPLALCIRVADCVPVLLADTAAGIIGAAHAGRRGFAAGILPATVSAMRHLGAAHIEAYIGPHICGACYEVPVAMAQEITLDHPQAAATSSWGTAALDLGAGCASQLTDLGCRVLSMGGCTREDSSYHSYRRDGDHAGRMGAFIWLE